MFEKCLMKSDILSKDAGLWLHYISGIMVENGLIRWLV